MSTFLENMQYYATITDESTKTLMLKSLAILLESNGFKLATTGTGVYVSKGEVASMGTLLGDLTVEDCEDLTKSFCTDHEVRNSTELWFDRARTTMLNRKGKFESILFLVFKNTFSEKCLARIDKETGEIALCKYNNIAL